MIVAGGLPLSAGVIREDKRRVGTVKWPGRSQPGIEKMCNGFRFRNGYRLWQSGFRRLKRLSLLPGGKTDFRQA